MTSKREIGQRVALAWSLFMIFCAASSFLAFSRNEVWSSSVSIYGDAAQKAPLHPRAQCNYAMALLKEGRFEEGIQESEKALALEKDNFEQHLTAANNIVMCLLLTNKPEEAAERGEFYLNNKPKIADEGQYPRLALAISLANRRAGHLEKAYKNVHAAMMWARNLPFTKETRDLAEIDLREILQGSRDASVDIDKDGSPDPGALSEDAWMARAFLKWGEADKAEELLKQAVRNPEDLAAQQMLASFEDARRRNRIAARDWDFEKQYLLKPFSRHNVLIGSAYLLSKMPYLSELPWCREASRSMLKEALQIDPHSADAQLLLAWQDYAGGDIKAAAVRVREALVDRPEYARAWIQLGFFLRDAPSEGNAVEAFREGLRLYPAYPKRAVLEKIILEQEMSSESVEDDSIEKIPVTSEVVSTRPSS